MVKRVTRVEAKQARNELVRVIVYCRVSTDDQYDNGTSLETQKEDCTAYCASNGHQLIDVVQETYSGYVLEERKKLMEVMRRCESGEVDAIVFRTFDRLSRNKSHFTVILYEADRYGYELLCVNEQFDKDNMFEAMLRDMVRGI